MTGAFVAQRDFDHPAVPVIFGAEARFEGVVIVRTCRDCGGSIWRTPERGAWSHSVPSRTGRLTDPTSLPRTSSVDVVLTRHLGSGE